VTRLLPARAERLRRCRGDRIPLAVDASRAARAAELRGPSCIHRRILRLDVTDPGQVNDTSPSTLPGMTSLPMNPGVFVPAREGTAMLGTSASLVRRPPCAACVLAVAQRRRKSATAFQEQLSWASGAGRDQGTSRRRLAARSTLNRATAVSVTCSSQRRVAEICSTSARARSTSNTRRHRAQSAGQRSLRARRRAPRAKRRPARDQRRAGILCATTLYWSTSHPVGTLLTASSRHSPSESSRSTSGTVASRCHH